MRSSIPKTRTHILVSAGDFHSKMKLPGQFYSHEPENDTQTHC